MTDDVHQRAGRLMGERLGEGLKQADQEWLDEHLESCAECRERLDATQRAIQSLRSAIPEMRPTLVSATQLRVRQRALELREERVRLRALWISCALSWVLGVISAPLLWEGLKWAGQRFALPEAVRLLAFAFLWTVPAALAGAALVWRRAQAASENGYTSRM